MKSVLIRSYSGPYFPAFGLNTDQNDFEYEHFLGSEKVEGYLGVYKTPMMEFFRK